MVNDVSNWYVRRSRRRLWDEADSHDKLAASTRSTRCLRPFASWSPLSHRSWWTVFTET